VLVVGLFSDIAPIFNPVPDDANFQHGRNMKLHQINEVGLRGRMAIHDTADAVGDLIRYVYDVGTQEEKQALDAFLKAPEPRGWDNTKWLIDSVSQRLASDPNMTDNLKKWGQLKTLTAPVVTAAIYDIDPQDAKGTPLQSLVFGKSTRDKYKLALGPQGYVATMSGVGNLGTNKLRDMLRATAKDGRAIAKSVKKDLPQVKPVTRF